MAESKSWEKYQNIEQLNNDLPYLGNTDTQGRILLFQEEIDRPNYSIIKSNRMISLKNCVRILIGIENLHLIGDKEIFLIRPFASGRNPDQGGWGAHKPSTFKPSIDDIDSKDAKYFESWYTLINFIHGFIKKVVLEANAGFIEMYNFVDNADEYKGLFIRDVAQNSYECYFKTLPLLKWAKESGYVIPNELSFKELRDGTLKWDDSEYDCGTNEYSRNSQELTPEENLKSLLLDFFPEVENLWNGIKEEFKKKPGNFKSIASANADDLKGCALKYFDKINFKHLKIEYIDEDYIYEITDRQKRSTVGKILKIVVQNNLSMLLSKIPTSGNKLYSLASKASKLTKK